MNPKTFSIGEALSFGKAHALSFLPFCLVMVLLRMVASAVPGAIQGHLPLVFALALNAAVMIFQYILSAAFVVGTLMVIDGEAVSYEAIKAKLTTQKVVVLGVCSFLVGLATGLGMILLVVPGVLIALMFTFYNYLAIDQGKTVGETLKATRALTKGVRGNLFVWFLICAGVNILGLLCLGVGLLFTIPLTTLANAYVYRQLAKQA